MPNSTRAASHHVSARSCVASLVSAGFSRSNWIQGGAKSPYEFEVANKYAVAARVDNYSIPGLRIGLSGIFYKPKEDDDDEDDEDEDEE